ncbi:MAG: ATP-dependent RecD-like DNA helicase [Ruminococcaceae bacterium]|nr:ATP-dependent RecD-like DNA helicase [Oscillospiraceae bacterium]
MEEIRGLLEEIIFDNEENGYKVCAFDMDGEYITVRGIMPYISPGEYMVLKGHWENHKDYGPQFAVETYEKKLPEKTEDIEIFLSSGLVEGVGPATARLIVDNFGADSINVILEEPYRLETLKGISHQKAVRIHETLKEHQNISELVVFLSAFKIGTLQAAKIFKVYGQDSVTKIKENPFCLYKDVPGIGFKKIDEIASSIGFPATSDSRIEAGVINVLSEGCQGGHVYAPMDVLVNACCRILGCEKEHITKAVEKLNAAGEIKITEGEKGPCVYLWSMYNKELFVSRKLSLLSSQKFKVDKKHFEDTIKQFENYNNITPDERQKTAVFSAGENGFSIITGGPGTGKTTIIRCILHYLRSIGLKCLLAAPTGRAAKRMSEACGEEAKTIHRLLEINTNIDELKGDSEEVSFKRNETNPLDAEAVIVDESSMIDMVLFYHLLRAIKPGTRLIIVGDVDQLPSVGPGSVLSDCIASGVFNTVILEEIYRQESESLIPSNARSINKGVLPKVNASGGDFFLIRAGDQYEILDTVVSLCSERLPNKYGVDPLTDLQVIIPTKKGPCGVFAANKELQRVLNPKASYKREIEAFGNVFREGDRVMQVKNDYEMEWTRNSPGENSGTGVFNGEMGILAEIDTKARAVRVVFDDEREAIYDGPKLANLELCYAVTVHKSQGSEFDYCILPIFSAAPMLMTRNLLYTAVTRAKKMVILIGREEHLATMVGNDKEQLRYTGLKELLCRES